MNAPLLTLALILGIVVGFYLPLPRWFFLVCLLLSAAAALLLVCARRPRLVPACTCLFICMFCLGALRASFVHSALISGRTIQTKGQSAAVEPARENIRANIKALLAGDEGGLTLGILLGDTADISPELKCDFQRTGLTHILAVSGMNVGVLVAATFILMGLFSAGRLLRYPAVVGLVVYYAALTRFQPSVLRASVMALIALVALAVGRRHDLLNALSVAAFALLVYEPQLLLGISFQLSFAATLAIIVLMPVLDQVLAIVPRRLRNTLNVCLAAQLGVAPLLVYHFRQLSAVAPLANVLVVTATYPVLVLGMILPGAAALSAGLAQLLAGVAHGFLTYIIATTHALADLPLASFSLGAPSVGLIVGYYGALGLLFWWLRRTKRRAGLALILIVTLSFAVVVVGCEVGQARPPSRLTVTFLDVGQGDATVIQTPEGQTMLVDGGEVSAGALASVQSLGVRKIDLLIVSHPHADHVGGLAAVLSSLRVERVLDGGQSHTSRLYRDLLAKIEQEGIRYQVARSGQALSVGPKLKIELLAPSEPFISGTRSDLNNNSVVARVTYGEFVLLLPGDVEKPEERRLTGVGADLSATVLKVPHHGSSDAGDEGFLAAVDPKVAVISVGKNDFGHPSRTTLARLASLGARVYRTDQRGRVTILSNGKTFEVETSR